MNSIIVKIIAIARIRNFNITERGMINIINKRKILTPSFIYASLTSLRIESIFDNLGFSLLMNKFCKSLFIFFIKKSDHINCFKLMLSYCFLVI